MLLDLYIYLIVGTIIVWAVTQFVKLIQVLFGVNVPSSVKDDGTPK